jgi:very-short-patch-repair endonuclease
MDVDARVSSLAAQQGGCVSIAQIRDLGITDRMIWWRTHKYGWVRVGAGYRVFEMPGAIDRVRGACAVLPTAVVSHETAGAIHGLRAVSPDVASVTVSPGSTHDFPGVEVHRVGDLDHRDVVRASGLPVTTVARTVVDLAASRSMGEMIHLIHAAVDDGLVTHAAVREVVQRVGRRGKPGIALMRALVGEPDEQGMSALERRGFDALRSAGLEPFEVEHPLPWSPNRRFDVAFPEARVAVEWDSVKWHGTQAGFRRDRRRDRECAAHGWRLLRFTWTDLEDPDRVADDVKAVLSD